MGKNKWVLVMGLFFLGFSCKYCFKLIVDLFNGGLGFVLEFFVNIEVNVGFFFFSKV